jgi:hypothetical protein
MKCASTDEQGKESGAGLILVPPVFILLVKHFMALWHWDKGTGHCPDSLGPKRTSGNSWGCGLGTGGTLDKAPKDCTEENSEGCSMCGGTTQLPEALTYPIPLGEEQDGDTTSNQILAL